MIESVIGRQCRVSPSANESPVYEVVSLLCIHEFQAPHENKNKTKISFLSISLFFDD